MRKSTSLGKNLAQVALNLTKTNINSVCMCYLSQPKMPEGYRKLLKK
ncbi:MAG: cyclic lactone autoinducer peptide [Lachnospiraceae bacterium]|jgi:cyclic lactone autoinducer peptide|nr:cyclic lactone autoinducer peptide [Lachnospiraceae bacterium]